MDHVKTVVHMASRDGTLFRLMLSVEITKEATTESIRVKFIASLIEMRRACHNIPTYDHLSYQNLV